MTQPIFQGSQIDDYLRDASNLEYEKKKILLKKDQAQNNENEECSITIEQEDQLLFIPRGFELINEDIIKLLMEEKFFVKMNAEIMDKLCYEVLLGNNQIIVKNKIDEKNIDIYNNDFNELYIYFNNIENKKYNKKEYEDDEDNDTFILKYILDYDKKDMFFNDFTKIIKNGLQKYLFNS